MQGFWLTFEDFWIHPVVKMCEHEVKYSQRCNKKHRYVLHCCFFGPECGLVFLLNSVTQPWSNPGFEVEASGEICWSHLRLWGGPVQLERMEQKDSGWQEWRIFNGRNSKRFIVKSCFSTGCIHQNCHFFIRITWGFNVGTALSELIL